MRIVHRTRSQRWEHYKTGLVCGGASMLTMRDRLMQRLPDALLLMVHGHRVGTTIVAALRWVHQSTVSMDHMGSDRHFCNQLKTIHHAIETCYMTVLQVHTNQNVHYNDQCTNLSCSIVHCERLDNCVTDI